MDCEYAPRRDHHDHLCVNVSDEEQFPLSGSMNHSLVDTSVPCYNKYVTFNFYMNFVIIGTLCVCGLVGNSLSILVLRRDPQNKVAVFLLKSLAVADNLLLVVSFVSLSVFGGLIPYLNEKRAASPVNDINIYLPIITNPLGTMAQTVVVWFTLVLALNRFIAICIPFKSKRLCTARIVRIQVAMVVIFAVCFNFPRFFQYRIKWTYHNGTEPVKELVGSEIGRQTTFGIVYTNALYSILVLILPLLLLVGLNCRLIQEIRAARRRASNVLGCHRSRAPAQENISFIMVIIVVVFIACQTPDRIYQVLRLVLFRGGRCDAVKSKVQAFCNLLIIINSSCNFIIYYVCRKSFRKILKQRLCTNTKPPEHTTWQSTELLRTFGSDNKIAATFSIRDNSISVV